ncbi:MAG: SDR family NAD(P)-dependent oxidoreductase [SAR202 cluster bacterium]|jgi:alcohol dehydrogenase|nr:SDR family NAD(P)-dependent oxidoreductase [SAR202 cluster bacterium]|tara:strand:- start:3320 stop:4321 length:1002 start_codon:yes stop_codon:yes gene_type:complete
MRAAVVREHGEIENILIEDDFPEPDLEPGWARIAVKATSLNYHDLFTRRGMPGINLPLPLVVGSDIAGEVVEVAGGVVEATIGNRVLIDPLNMQRGMIGERWNGGRAEYCVADAKQLVPIPDTVSYEIAACIPLAYATAHRMMVTRGDVKAEDTVLVMGASGGVGTACVLLAKRAGATVISCASTEEKLERLKDLGSDHGVNYVEQDMREASWEIAGKPRITGEGGVDLLVNCTGGGSWIDSTRCMRKGGRLVTCGATAGFEDQIDIRYVWTYEHSLLGSNGWHRSDIVTMLEYAAEGSLLPVIDRVMPLEEVHEAERLMEEREVFGKIVLQP